ncbi:hypothetical protein BDAP_001087 [Binucleata daphniae]
MILLLYLAITSQVISQNFASSSSGSFVFQHSKNLNRPNSVITPKSNYYLTGKCKYSYLTIKLAHSVRIKRIEITNNEWFASFITKIKISILVDEKYVSLGVFDLKVTRKTNKINIDTKYFSSMLNLEFIGFSGKHDFFTISSVQVYGTTLIEEFLNVCQKGITSKLTKKCIRDNRTEIIKYVHKKHADLTYFKYIFIALITSQLVFILYKYNIININI